MGITPRPSTLGQEALERTDLRLCPLCAHDQLTVAAVGRESIECVAVMCLECGAVGPIATADDPAGHAQHLSQ
jgi:uncharacterized Zn finger protein